MLLSLVLLSIASTPQNPKEAVQAIAAGEDSEAAVESLKAAGKPGLWALHGAAKDAKGVERTRLFAAIGKMGGSDAEWALVVELKSGDAAGKLGAIAGLGKLEGAGITATLLSQAGASNAEVRAALVDVLVERKISPAQLEALQKSDREEARETGVRYLAGAGSTADMTAAIPGALADRSMLVRRAGLRLVAKAKDPTRVFTIAEMARGTDPALAIDAIHALRDLGGFSVPGELAAIASRAQGAPEVKKEAALALRAQGRAGMNALVGAIGRLSNKQQVAELSIVAAADLKPEEMDAVIDLLEDSATQGASAAILDQVGEAGRKRAEARLQTALPELHTAITAYLAKPPSPPPGAETVAGK
jgi:hypothetical protein